MKAENWNLEDCRIVLAILSAQSLVCCVSSARRDEIFMGTVSGYLWFDVSR
jgi:hypothetical protein